MTPNPASVAALDAVPLPGPSAVGWERLDAGGQQFLLFYPAAGGGAFTPSARSRGLTRRFGAEAAADLSAALGPAARAATPRQGRYPLILFAPGAGLGASDFRWLLAGLASRGALVLAIAPDGSPPASEERVVDIATGLLLASVVGRSLGRYGQADGLFLLGHSIGGAGAILALADIPGARAVNIDGDFLGKSRAPAAGPALLISGWNPDEPERAEKRRTADWQFVSAGQGERVVLRDMRHLGATDAALLPASRRDGDLGPNPAAIHRAIGERVAAFLLERR